METGTAGGRFDGSRQRKQVQVTDEENQLLEAALRTPSLLEKLNAVGCTVGRRVYPVKLGSIGVAALKLLLGTVAFVDPGPTEQLSMQHFQLPHIVPPSPPPVQPAWTAQTVSVAMETVAYAQHLADRALAAIRESNPCGSRSVRGKFARSIRIGLCLRASSENEKEEEEEENV